MSLETWLTKTCGVKAPFVQGGLQWVATGELVAAVANAGGLGFLSALSQATPEDLRKEIRKTRAACGGKQFGVNLTMLPSMNAPDYAAYAQVAVDEGIRLFETAGNPKPVLPVIRQKKRNIIIHKCVSVKHAIRAEQLGVDAISIDGFECAGHPGEDDVTSLILLARVQQVCKLPIIASGGFADGSGCAAAFATGAVGVNMGTRWLATTEAPIHDNIKQAMVEAKETDTALLLRQLNNSVRCFLNPVSQKVLDLQAEKGKDFKFDAEVGALMSGQRGKQVYSNGDKDFGIWSLGQSVGLINEILSCDDLVKKLTKDTIEKLQASVSIIKDANKL